jgi:putative heme-binding domain-containing protein
MLGGLLALLVAAQDAPPAVPARVPWTGSRVTGSPEPPLSHRAERAWPALTFAAPVHLLFEPGAPRGWLVEQRGRIATFRDDPAAARFDTAIDLRKELLGVDRIPDCRGVTECYALAFHPRFVENRFVYVMYVLGHKNPRLNLPLGSRISRFTVTPTDPPRLDPASEKVLLEWLAGGHNGCDLQFGPDGFLYISTGDGAGPSPPDPLRTGQDCSDLLSCILRIDVDRAADGRAYAVPPDNPFVGRPGVRPEIWAYGFRNPWRMSFDRSTGHLWVGDVGWERWELVFRIEKGANYGWSLYEGRDVLDLKGVPGPSPIRPPAQVLPHPEAASVTGGFVYRGKRHPDLAKHYVFGDWETRRVWASPLTPEGLGPYREIARTDLRIVALTEDRDGELLLVDHEAGGLHRLVRNEVPPAAHPFPRRLGGTGLFASVKDQIPAPGVVPYSINAPRWADGATGERWLAVPGDAVPGWKDDRIAWPRDSVLAKTLALEGRKVETQLLHFDGLGWNAYSYLWNDDGDDADLVGAAGTEKIFRIGGREHRWNVLPRAACLTCHNIWPGYAISMNAAQLERVHPFPGGATLPLRTTLTSMGLLPQKLPGGKPLANPYDGRLPLAERARSWLSVNCSVCHRFGGGGSALIDLRHDIPLEDMKTVDRPALLGSFGLDEAPKVVAPGDPARSVLLCRIAKLGQGHMPRLGSAEVDEAGLKLLAEWIRSLAPVPPRRDPTPSSAALETSLAWNGLADADRAGALAKGLASTEPFVRDLYERFVPPGQRKQRLGTAISATSLLARPGDAGRGRALFESGAVQCKACHRVGEGPERLGPDLAGLATRLARAQILESILEPSKLVDPKFAGVVLQTSDGEVLSGILVSKDEARWVLRDAEKSREIPAAKVVRSMPQAKSMMPEGLLQDLSAQEAADLLEFLAGLK